MTKVLLVDDSSVMRKIIQKNIKAANLQVDEFIEASDGKEARAESQGGGNPFSQAGQDLWSA